MWIFPTWFDILNNIITSLHTAQKYSSPFSLELDLMSLVRLNSDWCKSTRLQKKIYSCRLVSDIAANLDATKNVLSLRKACVTPVWPCSASSILRRTQHLRQTHSIWRQRLQSALHSTRKTLICVCFCSLPYNKRCFDFPRTLLYIWMDSTVIVSRLSLNRLQLNMLNIQDWCHICKQP